MKIIQNKQINKTSWKLPLTYMQKVKLSWICFLRNREDLCDVDGYFKQKASTFAFLSAIRLPIKPPLKVGVVKIIELTQGFQILLESNMKIANEETGKKILQNHAFGISLFHFSRYCCTETVIGMNNTKKIHSFTPFISN